ncbi:MAG TPA: GNAT family protein [Anaerolineae bacterium]|nr:GNAT family protein [Anaerolineae bacterium]
MSLPVETGRLILRRFSVEDERDLLALAADPSFSRAVPEMEPTESGVRRYLERQLEYRAFEPERVFDLAIERKSDRRVLGLLTLVRRDRVGAAGWALGARFRRQGYAAEAASALLDYAFRVLDLERVEAETAVQNEASRRLMERLGMRLEACLRGGTVADGQPTDSYLYAIRPGEWRAAQPACAPPPGRGKGEPCPPGDPTPC